MRRLAFVAALSAAALVTAPPLTACAQTSTHASRDPDVIFVPTPEPVVEKMLELAHVGPGDVVYDLGCGDGRLVVGAAKRGATRATGVDIDPQRVAESRDAVKKAGVGDRAKIVEGDLFEMDLSDATVVTLYLLPELNLRLRPKLLALKPGTRIVSHAFDMGDWKPDRVEHVDGKTVYLWTVPQHAPQRAQASDGRSAGGSGTSRAR